jgi:hypothetical protein
MMQWRDTETAVAIRLLAATVHAAKQRILLWIGAGASSWCGYPTWSELAEQYHSAFLRLEASYDGKHGSALMLRSLPDFFGYCRFVNPQRYRRVLAETFTTKPPSLVYQRFIGAIEALGCARIVTTNVDEALEHNLVAANTIQRSDLERVLHLLGEAQSFVAKIHGSISAMDSVVFTADDYSALVADANLQSLLLHILSRCCVVFFGYGLGDEYLIRILGESTDIHALFGDGPHFAVLPERKPNLPGSVHQIIYDPEPGADHRIAIRVLEEMTYLSTSVFSPRERQMASPLTSFRSAHFISDVVPPGTWISSQTFRFGPNNTDFLAYVGHGIKESELPDKNSTAMHDVAVGLLSFEDVFVPLKSAYRVHNLLGGDLFRHLVHSGVFRFVHWESEELVVYDDEPRLIHGSVGSVKNVTVQTVEGSIRAQMKAVPGREQEAELYLERLRKATISLPNSELPVIPDIVRGLLLFPSIRRAIGISDAISSVSIPHWLAYPVLRLAHVVRVGVTCDALLVPSTKLLFGGSALAVPAFSACSGSHWADEMASYALSGKFNSDLGALILQAPDLLRGILRFRDSTSGSSFRNEVKEQLAHNEGAEVAASINAGLRRAIPLDVLERARNELVGLLVSTEKRAVPIPAVWNNNSYADTALELWRQRSRKDFEAHCTQHKIGPYDPYPCGSGDKVKFCCRLALS